MTTSPTQPNMQTSNNEPNSTPQRFRGLKWWEIQQLERQGCKSADWSKLLITDRTDLNLITESMFIGENRIGALSNAENPDVMIHDATLQECIVGDNVNIHRIGNRLKNCVIGNRVTIENVDRIEFEDEAACGYGLLINVLDEAGSRPVKIYPGMSAQMAALMCRLPRVAEDKLFGLVDEYLDSLPEQPGIGDDSRLIDCGTMVNVRIGRDVTVDGTARLKNGTILNNADSSRGISFMGHGVDAENFIIEDGRVEGGSILRNCYVGQGVVITNGFTAHDSLFFSNCSMENGEACALFAGPYTVSMHKSSLLIGCMTSFMNAGSATNQSNHMYKLGPVHWGILERGVKTSSNSYLMHGAKIGAFSLLMGDHKTHPDSSEFPFSYLFGDEKGATVVVPGMMLRSCGLLRDEMKWPTRDRRLKRKLIMFDRINFSVLNPHTISHILRALDTIAELLSRPADDDRFVRYKGMKFTRAALERAKTLYTLAICKYLYTRLGDSPIPLPQPDSKPTRWIDLAGQVMTLQTIEAALEADSIEEIEEIFAKAFDNYSDMELEWIGNTFGEKWREMQPYFPLEAKRFDEMVEEDRAAYRDNLSKENRMLDLI